MENNEITKEEELSAAKEAESAPVEAKGKKNKPKKPLGQEILEWVWTIIAALLIAFVIRTCIFEPVKVDGHSMDYTLADQEIMYVSKLEYTTAAIPFTDITYPLWGSPKRFDVIICRYPNRGSTNFVKRVVGLPGDKIAVEAETDANGKTYGVLYVNGERYAEDYLVNRINYWLYDHWDTNKIKYTLDNPYTVPEGKYFVLGDNRSNSNDSHILGPIDRSMVLGHVVQVVYPFSAFRSIPNGLDYKAE